MHHKRLFLVFFLFILLLSGGGNGPPGLVTRLIVGTEQPRTLETREKAAHY